MILCYHKFVEKEVQRTKLQRSSISRNLEVTLISPPVSIRHEIPNCSLDYF